MSPPGGLAGSLARVRAHRLQPLTLAADIAHRVVRPGRSRLLRSTYGWRIAQPRAAATLRPPSVRLAPAASLPDSLRPGADRIGLEAESILQHTVEYLGSGPVALGPRIDWHRDFKSGYRWAPEFYLDLEVTRLNDDSDAKVPWELSRGHHLLTLARAACLFEDERFAIELERQLADWVLANPPGHGINWVNAMEVALRAVNWTWAIGTLESWRPLAPAVRDQVTRSLQSHARHIAANLEGGPALRSNHYLADVLGLLAVGTFLVGDPGARRWRRSARRRLEREICSQVHDDGFDFEASTAYHGLALEIFLIAWVVAQAAGEPMSGGYRERLRRMLEASRSIRHPDGRIPLFGDQDSGRVLPGGFERPPTQDNLLGLGAAVLRLNRLAPGTPDDEVAWTLGVEAWKRLDARPLEPRPPRDAFPDAGLYVLRGDETHLVVRWGDVGQNGNGGHAHNDISSYELSYEGAPLIVDSGTYVYTADTAARDAFRSARAHNVLLVDGRDMHPVPQGRPFQLPQHARPRVEEWGRRAGTILLTGMHDGFRHADVPVVRRSIALQPASGRVEISDEVEATGRHQLESVIHLAPGALAQSSRPDEVAVQLDSNRVSLRFTGADAVEIEEGWVSDRYGVREPAAVIRARLDAEGPARLGYQVVPERARPVASHEAVGMRQRL